MRHAFRRKAVAPGPRFRHLALQMSDRRDDEPGGPPVPPDIQVTAPSGWPAPPSPLGNRPLPELAPLPGIGVQGPDQPMTPRRSLPRRIFGWIAKAALIFVVFSVVWVGIYRFVPPPFTLTMMGDVIAGHGVTKNWLPLSRIDPDMPRAAIAAEDAEFCSHYGFDYKAIAAAAVRNAQGNKRIRGGSTISQQTAKNVFLFQGGGYVRKAFEAWFTLLIETIWGKRRIMEVYLNVAETGIGTYGVDAGARRYFKHGAERLSVREAAQIAAVLPLPKKRAGISPRGFTRRYGNSIASRTSVVRNDRLDACLR
jgi:monofunctional biosynthetic peptidoglycan transglycosylase